MQNPPPDQPETSSTGLQQNVAGAISYIWIVGLVFFLMEKENRFIRFHALQSIIYGITMTVVMIGLMIVNVILAFVIAAIAGTAGSTAGGLAGLVVSLVSLVIWLIFPLLMVLGLVLAAIRAYQGKIFKFPIIGNIAEKIVNK